MWSVTQLLILFMYRNVTNILFTSKQRVQFIIVSFLSKSIFWNYIQGQVGNKIFYLSKEYLTHTYNIYNVVDKLSTETKCPYKLGAIAAVLLSLSINRYEMLIKIYSKVYI